MTGLFDDETPVKRTLGPRDRQILYERAHHRCENPACSRGDIEFSEMEVGHKKAYAKGGSTTLKNSVALCHRCNKLQGTDSWDVFLGKQGITVAVNGSKGVLSKLSLPELKYLASKHGLKLKATLVRGDFLSSDYHKPPSKKAYVRELAKVVSEKDAKSDLRALLNSRLR